jgi:hypothetical protein
MIPRFAAALVVGLLVCLLAHKLINQQTSQHLYMMASIPCRRKGGE